jgi:hypothetical protein
MFSRPTSSLCEIQQHDAFHRLLGSKWVVCLQPAGFLELVNSLTRDTNLLNSVSSSSVQKWFWACNDFYLASLSIICEQFYCSQLLLRSWQMCEDSVYLWAGQSYKGFWFCLGFRALVLRNSRAKWMVLGFLLMLFMVWSLDILLSGEFGSLQLLFWTYLR